VKLENDSLHQNLSLGTARIDGELKVHDFRHPFAHYSTSEKTFKKEGREERKRSIMLSAITKQAARRAGCNSLSVQRIALSQSCNFGGNSSKDQQQQQQQQSVKAFSSLADTSTRSRNNSSAIGIHQQFTLEQRNNAALSLSSSGSSRRSSSRHTQQRTFCVGNPLGSDKDFHLAADNALEAVCDAVDNCDDLIEACPDLDANFAAGVLTIDIPPHGTWVLNKQSPNRQIWWSSPVSGPMRFELENGDHEENKWVHTRVVDGEAPSQSEPNGSSAYLFELLTQEIKDLTDGIEIEIDLDA
jgi:frataxin